MCKRLLLAVQARSQWHTAVHTLLLLVRRLVEIDVVPVERLEEEGRYTVAKDREKY
jgi:hypothetical protein